MRKLFLIILVLLALITPSIILAQDDASWFINKPIKDFTFKGLKYVEFSELKPLFSNYIGLLFTYELFNELQDKLYALDKFNYIQGNAEPGDEEKNSVNIIFTVEEKPVISSIDFLGNSSISRNDLLDIVLVKIGDFKDDALLRIDEDSIKNHYLEKGYKNIIVSSEANLDSETQEISIVFNIVEGNKTTIKDIQFVGNVFASSSSLRGQTKSKKQDLFNSGIFQEEDLVFDKEKIINYYRKFGFIDIAIERVERQISEDEEKNRNYITLIFYINEGEQFTFDTVIFDGNKIFDDNKLLKYVSQKSGVVFNQIEWEANMTAIKSLYADDGYIYNQFYVNENRDNENKTISFVVNIVEKDKAHIENIIITGNEKTSEEIILRELPFEVGDIFSVEKIRDGYKNLNNLQYFSAIDIQTPQGTSEGLMDLVINVQEKSWADFKFGLSFDFKDFPIVGTFGWSDRNFMGEGVALSLDSEISPVKQGLALSFQDNYLFGKGFGAGASLSFYHNVQKTYQDVAAPIFVDENVPDPYTSKEEYNNASLETAYSPTMEYDSYDGAIGGNISYFIDTLLGRLGSSTGLSIALSYIDYDQDKFRPFSKTVRDNLENWQFVNKVYASVGLDDRDIAHRPENGYYASLYAQYAGGILGGARHYIKLKSRLEGFLTLADIPVTSNWNFQTVLATHAALGFIFPQFGGALNALEKEMLYLNSINGETAGRGWAPVGDGEAMLDFSIELRHPIVKEYLWWTWFFDGIALWPERGQFLETWNLEDFYFSFGGGLKLSIPGIPLRLYLAQRLKWEDGGFKFMDDEFDIGPLSFKLVVAIGGF